MQNADHHRRQGQARRPVSARLAARLRAALLALFALACLAGASAGHADTPPPGPDLAANPLQPLDTSSPSGTYRSFIKEMRLLEAHFLDYQHHKTLAGEERLIGIVSDARTLFDLAPFPPALRDKMGGAAIMYLADILNRLPEVPSGSIPGAPGQPPGHQPGALPDKWRIPGTGITIAKMAKGPSAGAYLFTADTIADLPRDHALIMHLPPLRPIRVLNWRRAQVNLTGPLMPDRLVRALPDWALGSVLGTPVWKIAASLLLVALAFFIALAWGGLARKRSAGDGHLRQAAWGISRPVVLFLAYVIAVVLIRSQLNLSGNFAAAESFFSTIILYVTLAWMAWAGCFFIAEAIIASPQIPDNSFDSHLLRLSARLLGFAGAVTLLLYGANALGIPALGLVAGLGVGGIAVALASQSTVENLIGGFSIFADRPFRVGDAILLAGAVSLVESIGPRSSRLRAKDGTLTTVPNSELAKMHITNYSMRNRCLFSHQLGLRYETTPEQCEWLVAEIRHLLAAHPSVERSADYPRVVLTGFGDSAIMLDVEANLLITDWTAFLRLQQEFLLAIMRLVSAAGTGFAFPSQTTYLAQDSGVDTSIQARIVAEMAGRGTEPREQTAS